MAGRIMALMFFPSKEAEEASKEGSLTTEDNSVAYFAPDEVMASFSTRGGAKVKRSYTPTLIEVPLPVLSLRRA